jgi:hypothetical protein
MQAHLITQADFTLNKCGRPVAPRGLSAVYIYRAFMIQQYFGVSPNSPTQVIQKEIVGETNWCLRAIQMATSDTTALEIQILLPNGKFLVNNLQDVLQVAGYGSYRYLFGKEIECPPGSVIQVTLADTNTSAAQPFAILFEGAYKYFVKGGAALCTTQNAAAHMPRYLRDFNENIMAPCWMQGIGPASPKGVSDIEWYYTAAGTITLPSGLVVPGAAAISVTDPTNPTLTIPIDAGSDFRCRRLLFNIFADDGVNAGCNILVRVRTGSGYTLFNDYFDAATYIGSAPMVKDWDIRAADNVFVDTQFVNDSGGSPGTGNIYLQPFLEGTKRRAA